MVVNALWVWRAMVVNGFRHSVAVGMVFNAACYSTLWVGSWVLWGGVRGYLRFASCLGVLRTLGFYINFRQLAINGHQCCVRKHALRRKCSLMATPSKRDSVNAQSSFKFHSVDSQTISF